MVEMHRTILESMMDCLASIINNNLNMVMRFLAAITIIMSVPTMIGSFWGMNVNLPFQNSAMGFGIMLLISIILTVIVTWWLNKKDMLK
jgi:magnesium transporter